MNDTIGYGFTSNGRQVFCIRFEVEMNGTIRFNVNAYSTKKMEMKNAVT
jgi:hypothetical protein